MVRIAMVCSKTYTTPRRPFEKARLDQELKLIGEYGLRNKREVWRVKYSLAKVRTAARILLTLEEKDPKRLFEGNALLRRLVRIGVLDESKMKLDYVLGLKIEDFLERRLQTQVYSVNIIISIFAMLSEIIHKLLSTKAAYNVTSFSFFVSFYMSKDTPMKDNHSYSKVTYCHIDLTFELFPRFSSSGSPSPFITPVSSSDRGTSVSGSRYETRSLRLTASADLFSKSMS